MPSKGSIIEKWYEDEKRNLICPEIKGEFELDLSKVDFNRYLNEGPLEWRSIEVNVDPAMHPGTLLITKTTDNTNDLGIFPQTRWDNPPPLDVDTLFGYHNPVLMGILRERFPNKRLEEIVVYLLEMINELDDILTGYRTGGTPI